MNRIMKYNYGWFMFLVIAIFSGVATSTLAFELTDIVKQTINERFPDAEILEVEQEVWNDQPVIEIEIVDNGQEYEVLVSENGDIVSVKEEKGLPLIGGDLAVGIAVRAEREIYKGVDTEIEPSPFFTYENGPLEILAYDGIDVAWCPFRSNKFSLGLHGSVLLEEGYDADDSDFLDGMDELSTLYNAGIKGEIFFSGWEANLTISQDVSGEHDGQEVELSLLYPKTIAVFEIRPELSVTWMSEKTVDYFYGISADEARLDRPAYSPGSSFEAEFELMIQRQLYGNLSAVGVIGISFFGSDITDSPIVDDDYEIDAAFGFMYQF